MDETFEDVLEDIVADIRLYAIACDALGRPESAKDVRGLADRIELGRYKGAAGRLHDALRRET